MPFRDSGAVVVGRVGGVRYRGVMVGFCFVPPRRLGNRARHGVVWRANSADAIWPQCVFPQQGQITIHSGVETRDKQVHTDP